jgi:hypothetical protein
MQKASHCHFFQARHHFCIKCKTFLKRNSFQIPTGRNDIKECQVYRNESSREEHVFGAGLPDFFGPNIPKRKKYTK